MKQRIITGLVSAAAFLVVLLTPWSALLTIATSVIAAVAVYEILKVTKAVADSRIGIAAMAFAAVAPFFSRMNGGFVFLIVMIFLLVMTALFVLARQTVSVKAALPSLLLSLAIALCLSGLSYLRTAGNRDSDGLFYVFLALLMAWMSDAGAYFVGTFFGKHKLCPRISPKKTVEGLIGGIAISICISLFAGFVYSDWIMGGAVAVSYFEIFLLALVCAPLSVVGDLFASVIKRRHGVKDFGRCFPGHGGMMDRFDSLVFVFPLVYIVVQLFPLVYAV